MAAGNLPASGEPFMIDEIVDRFTNKTANIDGTCVRIIGRLDRHNVQECTTTVVDAQTREQLTVDTTLVEPFAAKIGSLFQFIGEVDCGAAQGLSLKARVVRCVDGIDVTMYRQALALQRQYLAARKDVPS